MEKRRTKKIIDRGKKLEMKANWLKEKIDKNSNFLRKLFKNLEWFGVIECKLPNME